VSAWLESFFWPTCELLLDVVDEDGGTACSARNGTDGRDGLVAGWPRTSWRENTSDQARTDTKLSIGGSGQMASLLWP
jgi:hypothetical protein